MASRLILHIGPQKSGTTYLQEVLAQSVNELAAAGVVYPVASGRRRRRIENHEWATYGLLGTEYPWVSERRAAEESDAWRALERRVARERGTVLLSAEALAVIRTPAIRLLLDRLNAPDVRVLVTGRALSRTLPSLWQQHVRNGRRLGLERYLRMLEEQRDLPASRVEEERDLHLWRAFALGRLVRRWAAEVGMDHVQVITSPGSPPHLLWTRFAEAGGFGRLADRPAAIVDRRVHTGLTAPEALVMASVNAALDGTGWAPGQRHRLRERILDEGFRRRDDRGPRIAIPPHRADTIARWSAEDLAELRECGVTVVGDLADLCSPPDDARSPTVEEIGAAGAAAVLAAAGLSGSGSPGRAR